MYTIGFTQVYYTLWFVSEPIERTNFLCSSKELVQECSYIQNLSIDYGRALDKMKARFGDQFKIDLELKGHSSFERILSSTPVELYEQWQFSFGNLRGSDIRECDDVWQLNRAMREEKGGRRKVYARLRLVELGVIHRNPFFASGSDRYISSTHLRYLTEKANHEAITGHFFENGQRVKVSIKRVGGTFYDTQYGTTFIERYIYRRRKAHEIQRFKSSRH